METKVKHILTIISIFLGGSLLASSASAIVTHEAHSDVQFTFAPLLTLTLSSTLTDCPTPYEDPTFCIEGLTPGTEALSNTVTATVNTNSSAGYTLSAKVAGTSLDGNHTFNNTDLVSLSGHSDKFEMLDDTVSTSLAAGEWGFTLTGDAVAPATPTYMTLSDSTERIINATVDKSGTAATGYDGTNTTDMNIGAYADTTQKAGLYGNVINFTATSNIQMRTVTVTKNNNDVASVEINSVDGDTITPVTTGSWADGQALGISATCAANKTFLGWGISGDFGSITNQDAATTTYNVGGNNVTLTAYCGSYIMQNITSSMCTSTPVTAIDIRDNKVYTIARLADGQCWMTSNLNLAGGTTLNADTSDVPTNNYYTLPASSASGFSSDTTAYVYNTGNETINQADCNTSPGCNSYYSWLAATAGGKDASGNAVTGDSYNAAYSICPKGWRLPTATAEGIPRDSGGYTGGDFYKMILAVKGVTSLPNGYYADPDSTPTFNTIAGPGTLPNFLLAGYYNSSTFRYGGTYGYYWSSSSGSSTLAHTLYFDSSSVGSAYYYGRRLGFSVRCILR
ncbi:hypothetical protein IKG07_02945 [Candidatus Saccharibacteria bacterium]|nr:hypothetical protein [Candidatus Saccharibacteria bacterium]